MTAFAKGFRDTGGGCASSDNNSATKKKDHSAPSDKVMHKSVSVQVDSVFGLHLTEGVYEIKRMETRSRSRLRSVIMICLFLAVAGIVGFGYFCNDQVSNNNNINLQVIHASQMAITILTKPQLKCVNKSTKDPSIHL